jgi:YgiT-type zinc finger domain-containing protein
MKNTKKKCYECGKKELIQVVEDVSFEGEGIEFHTVPKVPYEKCLACGNRFFGPEGQTLIDQYRRSMTERQFNGIIALRIPKSLHASLYQKSKQEGVSLNQLCLYLLSAGVDKSMPPRRFPDPMKKKLDQIISNIQS